MARIVKSAVRVLAVLELFDKLQRVLSVAEVARELGYPISSTSMLLGNLLEHGYLRHGPDQRTYFPTSKVTLLGAWVEPLLTPRAEILRMMEDLGEATGETIILGSPIHDQVQYLHVVPATAAVRMPVGPGTLRPLVASGLGRVLLATMDEDRVRHLVMRHNDGPLAPEDRISFAELMRELSCIRTCGYATVPRGAAPDAERVSMLLPTKINGLPLAVGIGGGAPEIWGSQREYVTLMRNAIDCHLRPPLAGSARANP